MISNKIGIYAIYAASFMFLVSSIPGIAQAKQNGKDKNEIKKEEKLEKKEYNNHDKTTRNCLKAFGHLFAKGWLKNNSSINIDDVCFTPFGISKKFKGVSTTTTDTTAPIISNVSNVANMGKAIITWNTDEKSDSYVIYSTINPVSTNSSSTPIFGNNSKVKNHWVSLNNLSAGTTYYYIVRSKDSSGNTSFSNQNSFTTISPTTTGDNISPIISNIIGIVSTTSVQVGWKTNEFSTSKVYYSTNTPVDVNSSNFVQKLSLDNSHIIVVPNLVNGTKCYFIIESRDNAGNISRSSEFNFTTQGINSLPDTSGPVISSISTSISSSTINLSWTTNEPSTSKVYFSPGSSVDANSTTTPFVSDSNLVINHTLSIPSLSTSTLYSMIIESKDSMNNRTLSNLLSTTTQSN